LVTYLQKHTGADGETFYVKLRITALSVGREFGLLSLLHLASSKTCTSHRLKKSSWLPPKCHRRTFRLRVYRHRHWLWPDAGKSWSTIL